MPIQHTLNITKYGSQDIQLYFDNYCDENGIKKVVHEDIKLDDDVSDKLPLDEKNLYRSFQRTDLSGYSQSFYIVEGKPVCLIKNKTEISIWFGGMDEDDRKKIKEELLRNYKIRQDDKDYFMSFMYNDGDSIKQVAKKISEPRLEDIFDNYSKKDKEALLKLQSYKPTKGGELIILNGPPGTGKTTALASLFNDWSKWANLYNVVDPLNFMGGSPKYMIETCLKFSVDEKWNIFVLEDAGEVIATDSKHTIGQGLSMFLNLTDGFIGKGNKCCVLITTNEEMSKLHSAVSRPGRLSFHHEFSKFSEKEAEDWLKKKNEKFDLIKNPVTGNKTLAELFALANNSNTTVNLSEKKLGFV